MSEDRSLWRYELPDGYRSPYMWQSADAATEHAAKHHPGVVASPALAAAVEGDPVGKSLGGFVEVSVRATAVKAWCGPRASGDFMAREAALRLDAGGVQVDIVGTGAELAQVRDRIVAAFDRGLGSV